MRWLMSGQRVPARTIVSALLVLSVHVLSVRVDHRVVGVVWAKETARVPGRAPERADDDPPVAEPVGTVRLTRGLAIAPTRSLGRSAVRIDALDYALARGALEPPRPGGALTLADGARREWIPVQAADDGSFTHEALRGGYVHFDVPSDQARVMLLEASGHSSAIVNGEPRAGDPYSHGYVRLPVLLRSGRNDILFSVRRGRLVAKLAPIDKPVWIDPADATLPDLAAGSDTDAWVGIVVVNATTDFLNDGIVSVRLDPDGSGATPATAPLPPIAPLTVRKVPVRITVPGSMTAAAEELVCELSVARGSTDGREPVQPIDSRRIALRVVGPTATRKATFLSGIDGSVQYYAVVPPLDLVNARSSNETTGSTPNPPALVMTLHGAGVEGMGQAACFAAKPGLVTIAPTNRRPFGFDWEDWGRIDALEVLEHASAAFGADRRRVYLTGHSMGGHGTWHLGATYPDRFAAIGPSAGWVSMASYADGGRADRGTPMSEIVLRAAGASDTLAVSANLAHHGVYVLHGDQDDNVPVAQARAMRKRLAEFHPDFVYREQPGAGHWWGNPCVDWPPMTDFFLRHEIPKVEDTRRVAFTTMSPVVSADCHWVRVDAQRRAFLPSSVRATYDPDHRFLSGTTDNVARIAFDLVGHKPAEEITIELDGQRLDPLPWPEPAGAGASRRVWLESRDGAWHAVSAPPAEHKRAERGGPFKEAFRNRMMFVHGTTGTDEENAWALAKARFDAEQFWYQGNGSVDIVSDRAFLERHDPSDAAERDRNVIVYGHAESNAAWPVLLASSPAEVAPNRARIGDRAFEGDDLACLFVRPRPGSDRGLVGVVAGTGPIGRRLANRIPYFVSGVGIPDCMLLSAESLAVGWDGVRAAGYFGNDWGVASGEFAWQP